MPEKEAWQKSKFQQWKKISVRAKQKFLRSARRRAQREFLLSKKSFAKSFTQEISFASKVFQGVRLLRHKFLAMTSFVKQYDKNVELYKSINSTLTLNPVKAGQAVLALAILLTASIVSVNTAVISYKTRSSNIINQVSYRQTQLTVAGSNTTVKWSALIKKSDLNNTTAKLIKLPKNATNIQVKTINEKQANDILSFNPKSQTITTEQRLALANTNNTKQNFFARIASSLYASLEDGVENIVETITQPASAEPATEGEDVIETLNASYVEVSPAVIPAEAGIQAPSSDSENVNTNADVDSLFQGNDNEVQVDDTVEETLAPVVEEPVIAPTSYPLPATTYVEVSYETEGAVITEEPTDTGKEVTVKADPSTEIAQAPLTDVLAYTTIPEIFDVGSESKIKIKWKTENNQDVTFHAFDTDNNNKLDYIEWTVPHLSEQVFEIIFISKAFHLDSNQNIVDDVYDKVATQDQVYTTIPNNEYIRVTFNQVLDNTKDITIYAKPNFQLPISNSKTILNDEIQNEKTKEVKTEETQTPVETLSIIETTTPSDLPAVEPSITETVQESAASVLDSVKRFFGNIFKYFTASLDKAVENVADALNIETEKEKDNNKNEEKDKENEKVKEEAPVIEETPAVETPSASAEPATADEAEEKQADIGSPLASEPTPVVEEPVVEEPVVSPTTPSQPAGRYDLPTTTSYAIEVYPVYTDENGNKYQGRRIELAGDGQNPDFTNIDHDGKYRILLSNLDQPTDEFDLRVVSLRGAGGDAAIQSAGIDFDYIVDPASWLTGWSHRKAITVANTNMASTTLSNFPLYVKISDTDIGANALSTGYDIRFTDSTGATLLPYERESWTGGSGASATADFWVKGTFNSDNSSSTPDTIYVYYGKPDATDGQDATNVWDSNYKAVYHLKETGTNPTVYDSTSNANNSTSQIWTPATAQINGGGSFSATSAQVITVPNADSLNIDQKTVSMWVKVPSYSVEPHDNYQHFGKVTLGTNGYMLYSEVHGNFAFINYGNSPAGVSDTTQYSLNTWYYLTGVYDGSHLRLYKNGDQIGDVAVTGSSSNSTEPIQIGKYSTTGQYTNQTADELRISSVARSADWIKFEYNNMNSANQELTFASQESNIGWLSGWTYRKKITISNANVGSDLSSFPLLVKFTSDANIGAGLSNSNGYEIRFTDSTGTTLLPYEKESFSVTDGSAAGNFWVKVPVVRTASSTSLYIYYGNADQTGTDWTTDVPSKLSACSSYADNATCVWDANYKGVWHLKETGTVTTWTDSTGVNNGANHSATATTGQISGGTAFARASSQYIDTTGTNLKIEHDITVSFWFKAGNYVDLQAFLGNSGGAGNGGNYSIDFGRTDNEFSWSQNGGTIDSTSSVALSNTNWHRVTAVRSGATGSWNISWYFDGVFDETDNTAVDHGTSPGTFSMGRTGSYNGAYLNGSLDEVRVSATTRSAHWIKFEYCNMTTEDVAGCTGTGGNEIGFADQETQGQAWLTGWNYRKKITFDHTKVGNGTETQTNFPAYIYLTGLSNVATNGADIRFTSSDGTTELAREIESYSTGTLHAWVKVPSLSHTQDTVIYMYYGNASATEPSASSTYGSQNVWDSNFKAVWHMNSAASPALDSTSNANSGAQSGGVTFGATGKIDGSTNYNGSSQYIDVGKNTTVKGLSAYTISAWFKVTTMPSAGGAVQGIYFEPKGDNDAAVRTRVLIENANHSYANVANSLTFRFRDLDAGSAFNVNTGASTIAAGTWYNFSAVWTSSSQKVYLSGAEAASASNSLSAVSNTNPFGNIGIGAAAISSVPTEHFNGYIDEIRISDAARSAGWIATEYNNQNSPTTFYSVDSPANTSIVWTNGTGNGLWNDAGNWQGNAVPTASDTAVFDSSATGNCTIDTTVNVKNFVIESGYTGAISGGAQTINVSGSWTNTSGVNAFSAGTSTVTLNGTSQNIAGSTTFYNLTKSVASADTLTITAGTTQTIASGGTLRLSGASGQALTLASSTTSAYTIAFADATAKYVANYLSVSYSTATGQNILALNSSGNNTSGWTFPTLTGTRKLYWVATSAGNWNDTNNWSSASGGTGNSCDGGSCVPTSNDDAIFDGNANGDCTISASASVKGLYLAGFAGSVSQGANTISVSTDGYYQGSGTFTGGSQAISVAGPYNLAGGTFTSTSDTLKVYSASARTIFTVADSATFTPGTGTVNFGNSSDYGVTVDTPTSGLLLYNLTIGGYYSSSYYNIITTGDTIITTGLLTYNTNSTIYGGTIEARANVTVGASTKIGSTQLSFLVAGDQTITGNGGAVGQIYINKSSGIVSAGSTNLRCTGFNLAGGTFTSTSGTLNVAPETSGRSFIVAEGTTFNVNSGTVQLGGSSDFGVAIDVPSAGLTFNNLRIGGYYTPSANNVSIASGDTITASGTLTFLAWGKSLLGTINAQGAVSIEASAQGGTSNLTFSGGNAQTFTNSGTMLGGTVTIDKSANGVTLLSAMSANTTGQDLAITNGTLNLAGYNLAVNDQFTIGASGTLKMTGDEASVTTPTSIASGAIIEYTATSGSRNIKDWTYTNAILKFTGSGGTFVVNTSKTTAGFSLGAGVIGKITSGQTLTVSGNFTSTATSESHATLSAVTPSSVTYMPVSGTATVNYVDGTDIDSTGGSEIDNSTGGSTTNCVNWYVFNTAPELTSVSPSPALIKSGNTLTITPTGQGDADSNTLYYYCNESGSATSANTLCSEANAGYSSPYSSMTCTYTPTGDATRTVYCRTYDGTAYSTERTNTYLVDSTAPSGGSVSYTDGYFTTASVPVTYSTGSDSGSGLNNSTGKIQRATATLTNGSCGSFSSFTDLHTGYNDSPYSDATVSSGNCYMYQYLIQDNTTNQAAYTSASVAKVDTSVPTTNDDFTHNDSWQATSQTITLTPADAGGSGLAWTKYCTDTNNTCDPATGTAYSTPVTISAEGTTYLRYASQDNVGNTQTTVSKIVKIDKSAPTTGASAVSNGSPYTFNTWANHSVTVTLTPTDSYSGVSATFYCTDTNNTCSPVTSYALPVTISTEGTSYIRYFSADNVTNTETVNSQTIKIDTNGVSVNAGADQTKKAQFTQTGSASSNAGIATYSWSKQSGTGTITFGSSDQAETTVSASQDGTFVIRLTATDNASNSNYDEFTLIWDTTAPTVGLTSAGTGFTVYGSYINGTGTVLGGTATDAGAGIDNTTCEYTINGSDWNSATWNADHCEKTSVAVSNGTTYTFNTRVKDSVVANQGTGTATATYTGDTVAPSTTDNSDTSWHTDNQTITLSPSDAGSGVANTYYCTYNYSDSACDPTDSETRSSGVSVSVSCASGATCQKYIKYYSADNVGNAETPKTSNLVKIDKQPPATGAGAGSYTFGTISSQDVTVTLTPLDSGSGVSATFYCTDANNTCSPVTLYTTPFEISTEGTSYIRYFSADNVTNTETTNSQTIKIQTQTTPVVQPNTGGGGPVLDTNKPKGPFTVLINGGAQETKVRNVALTLLSGDDTAGMIVSNSRNFESAGIEPYSKNRLWTLPDGPGQKNIYVKFYTKSGVSSDTVSASINYIPAKNPITNVVNEIQNVSNQITEFFGVKPRVQIAYPPVEISVPKAPQVALQGWDLLTVRPLQGFDFSKIPSNVSYLADQLPELKSALENLSIDVSSISDIQKLANVEMYLPGLTKTVLSDAEIIKVNQIAKENSQAPNLLPGGIDNKNLINPGIQAQALALAQGVPVAELSTSALAKIPANIVFARTAGEMIDINTKITIDDSGNARQEVSAISNKNMQLAVKPDKPARQVLGFMTLEKSGFSGISGLIKKMAGALAPEILNNGSQVKDPGILVQKFEYKEVKAGVFLADIQAPSGEGRYKIATVVNYEDNSPPKETNLTVVVNPEGYVYRQTAEGRLRLKNIKITLFWLDSATGNYELWPADKFLQKNPVVTDDSGKYAFLVPQGTYYLQAEAKGYKVYKSEIINIKDNNGIRAEILLKKVSWIPDWLNWQTAAMALLAVIVILLIITIIILIKGRKK